MLPFPQAASFKTAKIQMGKKNKTIFWCGVEVNKTKTIFLSEMCSCWACLCMCIFFFSFAYRHAYWRVWQGTGSLPFLEAPQALGSICSLLFSICPVPLSLTQSLILGDYELTNNHRSFPCQFSLIFVSFYDFYHSKKAKLTQVVCSAWPFVWLRPWFCLFSVMVMVFNSQLSIIMAAPWKANVTNEMQGCSWIYISEKTLILCLWDADGKSPRVARRTAIPSVRGVRQDNNGTEAF